MESCDNLEGFLTLAVSQEPDGDTSEPTMGEADIHSPSRRLGDERNANRVDHRWTNLHQEWNTPCPVAVELAEGNADPSGHDIPHWRSRQSLPMHKS